MCALGLGGRKVERAGLVALLLWALFVARVVNSPGSLCVVRRREYGEAWSHGVNLQGWVVKKKHRAQNHRCPRSVAYFFRLNRSVLSDWMRSRKSMPFRWSTSC